MILFLLSAFCHQLRAQSQKNMSGQDNCNFYIWGQRIKKYWEGCRSEKVSESNPTVLNLSQFKGPQWGGHTWDWGEGPCRGFENWTNTGTTHRRWIWTQLGFLLVKRSTFFSRLNKAGSLMTEYSKCWGHKPKLYGRQRTQKISIYMEKHN
jgi:hypothetical protein